MGQHTHHLPKHLGNWPCRVLETAANNGLGQMLQLVEYQADDSDSTDRIFVLAADLDPIRPDEPSTQYALAQDGCIWQHTHVDDDTTACIIGWRNTVNGSVITWDHLWDRHGPIRPLAEVPAVTAPWTHRNGIGDSLKVMYSGLGGAISTTVAGVGTDLTPPEAEDYAAALLDAARKARTHIAAKLAPGYEAFTAAVRAALKDDVKEDL